MDGGRRSEEQGKGTLEELMRERIRATIETIVKEELKSALGATRSQRVDPVELGIDTEANANPEYEPRSDHHRNTAGADRR
jgi:transposase-like protein